jgi:hypothetical protein
VHRLARLRTSCTTTRAACAIAAVHRTAAGCAAARLRRSEAGVARRSGPAPRRRWREKRRRVERAGRSRHEFPPTASTSPRARRRSPARWPTTACACRRARSEALPTALARQLKSAPCRPRARRWRRVARWVQAVADDLRQTARGQRGAALVVAGLDTAARRSRAGARDQRRPGRRRRDVVYTEPVEAGRAAERRDQLASLRELAATCSRAPGDARRVDTLIIIGGNPAYTPRRTSTSPSNCSRSPPPQGPGQRPRRTEPRELQRAPGGCTTTRRVQLHVARAAGALPRAWGDVRAFSGAASIIQPLIAPLYAGRTADRADVGAARRADV